MSLPLSMLNMKFIRTLFFFNDTATTEIYTLSLHDALPIWRNRRADRRGWTVPSRAPPARRGDRKSTRLNSSHSQISYAVFCLKKKNTDAAVVDRSLGRIERPNGILGREEPVVGDLVVVNASGLVSVNQDLFFFKDTATTEIYTLSLHDALPI